MTPVSAGAKPIPFTAMEAIQKARRPVATACVTVT
jgi:hypothetical protein